MDSISLTREQTAVDNPFIEYFGSAGLTVERPRLESVPFASQFYVGKGIIHDLVKSLQDRILGNYRIRYGDSNGCGGNFFETTFRKISEVKLYHIPPPTKEQLDWHGERNALLQMNMIQLDYRIRSVISALHVGENLDLPDRDITIFNHFIQDNPHQEIAKSGAVAQLEDIGVELLAEICRRR